MYEYQEKQISKIAKATAEPLAQWASAEEAPETADGERQQDMIDLYRYER